MKTPRILFFVAVVGLVGNASVVSAAASPALATTPDLSSVDAGYDVPNDLDEEASARLLRVIEALNREPAASQAAPPPRSASSRRASPSATYRPLPIAWPEEAAREDPDNLLDQWGRRLSPEDLHRSIEAALAAPAEPEAVHPASNAATPTEWTPVFLTIDEGTRDYAGRATQLAQAFDPAQGITTTWAGTVGGGLWKVAVVFPFAFWVPVSDSLPGSPSVGAFLVRPSNGSEILIGSGDGGRIPPGDGMYKSIDGGSNWTRSTSFDPVPEAIYRIRASSTNPALVLAASETGLFRSTDFGDNWSRVMTEKTTDIVQDPADSNRWLVAVRDVGVQVSTDGGESFVPFTSPCSGIPRPLSRMELAVTLADPSRVFALVANGGILNGIYRSDDSGCTWSHIEFVDTISWGQAFHASALGVDPSNANRVFVGMGGAQWTDMALATSPCWVRNVGETSDCGLEIEIDSGHADMTDFLFVGGTTDVLISNDGGVYVYDYDDNSIEDLGNAAGFHTLQTFSALRDLSAARTSTENLLVGTQDNGTAYVTGSHARLIQPGLNVCGDGGQTSISPDDAAQIVFSCGLGSKRLTSDDAGSTIFDITCGLGGGNSPIIRDPTPGLVPSAIYDFTLSQDSAGQSFLWFKPPGPAPPGCSPSPWQKAHTTALPLTNPNVLDQANNPLLWLLYVAQDVGTGGDRRVFVLGGTPGTMTWVERTPAGIDPPLSGVGADCHLFADRSSSQPETAYYTTGSARPSRAFVTTNAGRTWREVTGNLPSLVLDAHLREMIGDPRDLRTLIMATEVGVFRTDTADWQSPFWYRYMNGLPAVVTARNLEVTSDGLPVPRIRLGTFGQGVWEREIAPVGVAPTCEVVKVPDALLDGAQALEACRTLLSGASLVNTGNTEFYGGESVVIEPGFTVRAGASFVVGSCGHDICTTSSTPLTPCSPCVSQICSVDSVCCSKVWDDICVGRVESVCGLNCP